MAQAFLHGSGGASPLNFKVVGGTSAPGSPKENTIWINTSTAITSYVFSATQPTGSNGMVWISTGIASPAAFNALKKNGIQLYPLTAKQYVSGAWVDKTAKIYQGNAWKEIIADLWLYNVGDQCTGVTGGWSFKWEGSSSTLAWDTGSTLHAESKDSKYSGFVTKNAIDLTQYSKLCYEATSTNYNNNNVKIGVGTAQASNGSITFAAQKSMSTSSENSYVDISSLSGKYFVGAQVYSTRNVNISKLWLEV